MVGVVDFDREVATEVPIICQEAPQLRDTDASDARHSIDVTSVQELPASVVQLHEVLSDHADMMRSPCAAIADVATMCSERTSS